jgi:hypothetical protein
MDLIHLDSSRTIQHNIAKIQAWIMRQAEDFIGEGDVLGRYARSNPSDEQTCTADAIWHYQAANEYWRAACALDAV